MGRTVFISEKPSLGRTVAGAIGGAKDFKTYMECDGDCVVVFAEGHLFENLMPQEYDERYKKWRMEDLPLDIPELRVKPTERVKYRIDIITQKLKGADRVVHVGDPDREGQVIVDTILDEAGWTGKVERLWNMDQSARGMAKTMEEFKKGFPDNASPKYANLGAAAKARSEVDWRLGMNISRAIGCMLNAAGVKKVVSYGRFQSTVLAIIVQREQERRNFKPKTFYTPVAILDGVSAGFIDDPSLDGYDAEGYLVDKSIAEKICASIRNKQGIVEEYSRKAGKKAPPLPYDLTKLIQDANRKHGISAAKTNEIAQSLYDKGITTYPRVQCRYLPEDHFLDAPRILGSLQGIPGADTANAQRKGACYNTKKTDEAAHHAIVPTGDAWGKLSGDEMKVFKLVAQAYVLQFHPDQEFESQTLVVGFDGDPKTKWKATGKKITNAGWTAVFKDDDEDDAASNELPTFKKGQSVNCDKAEVNTGETKKPPAFTEASIMSAMENIDKFEPNPEYRKLLREAKGIGTGATRGGILELLVEREYITIAKGVITPTQYGEDLISYIPEDLKSPALTAIMEGELDEIAQGKLTKEEMVRRVKDSLGDYIDMVKQIKVKVDPSTSVECPICKKGQAIRLSSKKSGWFWKCQGECAKFFPDNKGKIVKPDACPKCGELGLSRFQSKKKAGVFFWRCDACSAFFGDDKGKPGAAFGDEETTQCPTCENQAVRRQSLKNKDMWYWRCKGACGNFRDENGKIGKNFDDHSDMQTDKCPECGGVAVRRKSAKGTWYWICSASKDHGPFGDLDGKPGAAFGQARNNGREQADCPHCKKNKVTKLESKNRPGSFFWACDKCGFMSDDNGKPGKLFTKKK